LYCAGERNARHGGAKSEWGRSAVHPLGRQILGRTAEVIAVELAEMVAGNSGYRPGARSGGSVGASSRH
jgi:hypothetical protein